MSEQPAAVEARGLGMRYGRRREPVLEDCSFRLPTGRICALVGPNGAGKSTLLALTAGLLRPVSGSVHVLGEDPAAARPRFAYVSQDKPLPPQLTIAATLRLGAELNRGGRWDAAAAERIAYDQDLLSPKARIRTLSGGQRTRVALALAFGKRAELMLLDEPMADLDPLARSRLMGALMAEAAEHGTTIVMSSHVLPELECSCDHLVLLGEGRVRLAGPADDLVAAHALITGTEGDLAPHVIVEEQSVGRGRTALIRPRGPLPSGWDAAEPSLEEVVLAHLRNPKAPALTSSTSTSEEAAV
ncbi:ABC transporter ATP-binding protein [Streptomyces sp. T-3]|nr:ABC transporter ATP-binding protein [Streptomyces sp. T-3]